VQLNILQKATACMDVINSISEVKQTDALLSQDHQELSQALQCIPATLLDLIAGTKLHVYLVLLGTLL